MPFRFRAIAAASCLGAALLLAPAAAAVSKDKHGPNAPDQETGFLNRRLELHGIVYRFQVYLPEDFRRSKSKSWPIILFLHGRGERGAEGMWQTQIGLPMELRDHPERWPFIVVMPQCPHPSFWTDSAMLEMAMAALDRETAEFGADPQRTYLTGLSMGGYGVWELAKMYPKRWAAIAIASGGVFWSYAPERWRAVAVLPLEYAHAIGRTPIWLFHGSEDTVVPTRESELMYSAFKADGGHIRLWIYQGLHHDSWTRAYNEPDLPRWLLMHRLNSAGEPFAERLVLPQHPTPIKLSIAALDAVTGEYRDAAGHLTATLYRQGDQLYQKDSHGEVRGLEAESANAFFYPAGGVWTRLTVERDKEGRVSGLVYRDDRYEERWERKGPPPENRQTAAAR